MRLAGRRGPAGLPRQRGHLPEADSPCWTPSGSTTSCHNANVHRGIHTLAEEATALYEQGRDKLAAFLGAGDPREIIFGKNVTEGLNLLAHSLGAGLQARR